MDKARIQEISAATLEVLRQGLPLALIMLVYVGLDYLVIQGTRLSGQVNCRRTLKVILEECGD